MLPKYRQSSQLQGPFITYLPYARCYATIFKAALLIQNSPSIKFTYSKRMIQSFSAYDVIIFLSSGKICKILFALLTSRFTVQWHKLQSVPMLCNHHHCVQQPVITPNRNLDHSVTIPPSPIVKMEKAPTRQSFLQFIMSKHFTAFIFTSFIMSLKQAK